ncbi:MAG: hypothetical protein ISQ13_00615 [Candidatus Margulisbacteria bacterium]|jgi:hypothetical protein|nr:hypothetical protein [Candidatus Margulisiibacteriota bacterium]
MFVKYNKEGILSLPVPGGTAIVLKPGVNPNIKESDWSEVAKNPIIKKKIDDGIIVPMPSKLKAASNADEKKKIKEEIQSELNSGAAKDLAEYTVKEATKLITETYDVEILKQWKYEENRSTVQKAIDEQLELISSEGKKK